MIFRKKKTGKVLFDFEGTDLMCWEHEISAKEVTHDYCLNCRADAHCLLYRDGLFMGAPLPEGGFLYPFSTDPRKRGGSMERRRFHSAKIVYIRKEYLFPVKWEMLTALPVFVAGKSGGYQVSARGGACFVIDSRYPERFYLNCLPLCESYHIEHVQAAVSAILRDAVAPALATYFENNPQMLHAFENPTSSMVLELNEQLCQEIKGNFDKLGLILDENAPYSLIGTLSIDCSKL